MIFSTISGALIAIASPAATLAADSPQTQAGRDALSLEGQTLLRCSAAFALVSHGQGLGNEDALKWPVLDDRGKEFFVRALAGLMDDSGLDRQQVSQLVTAEAQRLWDEGSIDQVMPACLLMLETSGV